MDCVQRSTNPESSMVRLASLVGLVALTVAAAALINAAQQTAKKVSQDNEQDDAVLRITSAQGQRTPSFHARFSLN